MVPSLTKPGRHSQRKEPGSFMHFMPPGIPSLQVCKSLAHSSISVNIEQEWRYKKGVEKLFFRSTENKSQSIAICIGGYCVFVQESVSMLCSIALWDTIAPSIVL